MDDVNWADVAFLFCYVLKKFGNKIVSQIDSRNAKVNKGKQKVSKGLCQ